MLASEPYILGGDARERIDPHRSALVYIRPLPVDSKTFPAVPSEFIAMTDIPDQMGFIDNPHAPDIFADGTTGYFLLNGNLRITFEAARVNHISCPGPINRVVIGRLVMPIEAAEATAKAILDFME